MPALRHLPAGTLHGAPLPLLPLRHNKSKHSHWDRKHRLVSWALVDGRRTGTACPGCKNRTRGEKYVYRELASRLLVVDNPRQSLVGVKQGCIHIGRCRMSAV